MSSSPGNEATGTPDEVTSPAAGPAGQSPSAAATPGELRASSGTQPRGATPAGALDNGAGPPAQPGAAGGDPDAERSSGAMRTSLAQRFAAAKGERSDEAEDPTIVAPAVPATAGDAQTAMPGEGHPPAGAPRDEASTPAAAAAGAGRRRVRLAVARIDPWSVMKLAFLLSIAVGIGIMVAAAAMWYVLDSMHVFSDIRELLVTLDSESFLTLLEYAEFDRVISMAAIIAVIDIFLLTALATLGAFLYNIVAALVGGLHLTLTDD